MLGFIDAHFVVALCEFFPGGVSALPTHPFIDSFVSVVSTPAFVKQNFLEVVYQLPQVSSSGASMLHSANLRADINGRRWHRSSWRDFLAVTRARANIQSSLKSLQVS